MNFSYTLFLALLLLAPGFSAWAGFRVGERSTLIAQAPEKPGSTISLFIIVFGALIGHILQASLFALQSDLCSATPYCASVSFDPNVYRVILTSAKSIGQATDFAFLSWFLSLLLPAVATGCVAYLSTRWKWVRDYRDAALFGWLKDMVDQARPDDKFITAYVVTTLQHEGSYVAYQGIVQNIALDDNRSIKMLALRKCDRFLIRVQSTNVERINVQQEPIPLLQLDASQFINIALEVYESPIISEGSA